MTEWDGDYPDDHEEEVAYVEYMVSGWIKNMARDALGYNKLLSPRAVSVALRALSDEWAGMDSVVDFDEEIRKIIDNG